MRVHEGLLDIPSFATPYRASLLVLASQAVAAIIHGLVKTIETATVPIHPLQILLVRFIVTVTFCSWYLWRRSEPALEPAEASGVRPLLVIRAIGGILSAVGFYYSISYLPLSIATSINFLAPFCASVAIGALGKYSFDRLEIICSATALIGIVLIIQPESFIGHSLELRNAKETMDLSPVGLAFSFLGVLGGTVVYTAIQKIGKRAHPLLSVNYCGIGVITVSIISAMTIPSVKFTWDIGVQNWAILFLIGICGASMEWLLTAGLSDDKSSCATQMIYSQVLWALALDTIVWKETINMVALMGIGVVSASILSVSLLVKKEANERGTYEPVMVDDDNGYDIEVAEIFGGMDL